MQRLYLTLDNRLFDRIKVAAAKKGIPPTSLVVANLEDLYLRTEAIDYGGVLNSLINEARKQKCDVPFILAELPSFNTLIISSAQKAHISPSPVRARVGKSFNAAVRNGKVRGVKRAVTAEGTLLTRSGVALYIRLKEEE